MSYNIKSPIEPIIFTQGNYSETDILRLKHSKNIKVVDIYTNQLREYFRIKHPNITDPVILEKQFATYRQQLDVPRTLSGDWVYFRSDNTLLHTVSEMQNFELRTNRNRELITSIQQKKLANFTTAIAGLSVGSNIALSIVRNGFSNKLAIADADTLETSNLNRAPYGLLEVGLKKVDILRKKLFELDPYLQIKSFDHGLSDDNVHQFVASAQAGIIIEIIDDLRMKIVIRELAKIKRIPVLMVTSIHDTVLIDIERYDIHSDQKIFNGVIPEDTLAKIKKGISKNEINKYAVDIVGKKNVSRKTIHSLKAIGKTLVGRPQLISTINVAAGIATLITREIALGEKIPSGRTMLTINDCMR